MEDEYFKDLEEKRMWARKWTLIHIGCILIVAATFATEFLLAPEPSLWMLGFGVVIICFQAYVLLAVVKFLIRIRHSIKMHFARMPVSVSRLKSS